MEFDNDELRIVARAVLALNKHSKRGDTVPALVERMKATAYREFSDGGVYVSVGGFMLTRYRRTGGEIGIKASVSHVLFSDQPRGPGE